MRFGSEHSGSEATQVVIERTRELSGLPGVQHLWVAEPADEVSRAAWDLCLVIDFANLEDVEAFRVHPAHRAYVDEFLKPRLKVIKAWNFEVAS